MKSILALAGALAVFAIGSIQAAPLTAAESADRARFAAREQDWRNGAVVYQIIVDRFVPSRDADARLRELEAYFRRGLSPHEHADDTSAAADSPAPASASSAPGEPAA